MATVGEEGSAPLDDRWSAYQDPNKKSNYNTRKEVDLGPDFSEYVEKVVAQRWSQKEHDRTLAIATHVVHLLTSVAFNVTTEWKQFLMSDKKSAVKTAPLRTLSHNQYECPVLLKRPVKPGTFQCPRCLDATSMPRFEIRVNTDLSREEVMAIKNEWFPCIDKQGCLRASAILLWFNRGIDKACSILEAESQSLSKLTYHVTTDGTAAVHVSLTSSPSTSTPADDSHTADETFVQQSFFVNIFPVVILDQLLSIVHLHAPMPCYGRYVGAHKRIKQQTEQNLTKGETVAVLEPKNEKQTCRAGAFSTTWQIKLSFADQLLDILQDHCHENLDVQNILTLFYIIRRQFPDELGKLNNDILMNTLFLLTQKSFAELVTVKQWFLGLANTLQLGLKKGFLQSFQVTRLELFKLYNISKDEQLVMQAKIEEIITAVEKDSNTIYHYTGYVEKKRGISRADSESSESSEEDIDDGDQVNDTCIEVPSE